MNKYKSETWKHKTKRPYPNSKQGITKKGKQYFYIEKKVLLIREKNGKFAKGKPILTDIRQKTYGGKIYDVGINKKGKIITRSLNKQMTEEFQQNRINYEIKKREFLKSKDIYRCAIVLNDIPIGHNYYGFRIIAFSRNKKMLNNVYPSKMKQKLIKFIEQCTKYRENNFWFDLYFGYSSPQLSNATQLDNNKYYLQWTKRNGLSVKPDKQGNIREL